MNHRKYALGPLIILLAVIACDKKKGPIVGGNAPTDAEAYDIKDLLPRVNVAVRWQETVDLRVKMDLRKGVDQQKEMNLTLKKEEITLETILADEGFDWTRLQVRFEQLVDLENGLNRAPAMTSPKPFILTRKKAEFSVSSDGQQPTPQQLEYLRERYGTPGKSHDMQADLLPEKPVRLYEEWRPRTERLAKLLGNAMPVEAAKAKSSGKLVRVFDENGHRFGVIEIHVTYPIVPDDNIPVQEGSYMNITLTFTGCIDGSICEGKFDGRISGHVEAIDKQGSLIADFDGTIEMRATERKAD